VPAKTRPQGSAPLSRPARPARDNSAEPAAGLYGSSVGDNVLRTAVAELVGTFLLVLVGTSVATTSVQNSGFYTAGFVGLAFGLALVALVAGLGHISGCHVNPAVTIGLAVTRKFPWKYVPAYVGAQFAGAVLASLVVWASYGDEARTGAAHLGAAAPGAGVGVWQAVLVEVVITFLLVFVVCSVATDKRVSAAVAPLAVGFALAAAVYVGVPVTGGAVNPARAFGPFLVSGFFPMWGVYLLAPVLGGVVGAVFYDRFIRQADAPSA
jgi:MIP family channel proteins